MVQRRFFTRQEREALAIVSGFRCEDCGCQLSRDTLEADHIVPVSAGGSTVLENGQALCGTCNKRKGSRQDGKYRAPGPHRDDGAKRFSGSINLPVHRPTPGFNDRWSQTGFMDAFVSAYGTCQRL